MRLLAIATCGILVVGCGHGADGRDAAAPTSATEAGGPSTATVPPAPAERSVAAPVARARIAAAVRAASREDRSFTTALTFTAGDVGPFHATLDGIRRADGSSRARLRWSGAARLVVDDVDLVVADNRIRVRPVGTTAPWQDLGSASGVALDVGRELLDHPQLLHVTEATARGDDLGVSLVAPIPRLRAYATTERAGPVTELLRGARSLRIRAQLSDGRLVGDTFSLRTRVPAVLGMPAPLRGLLVDVEGMTAASPTQRRSP